MTTDTERAFTVPEHLERPVRDLIVRLQALTEAQLCELRRMQLERSDPNAGRLVSGQMVYDNPVAGVEWAFHDLRVAVHNHRLDVVQAMEAQMNGGHLVSVSSGNQIGKYAAACDANPPGEFCWEGPDRDTIEEAIEDARAHHPGHEPKVADRLSDEE